nr:hypothetical protein [uncultured Mediterranean phage uvMED]BAR31309.1 hypothetical protein [uncultured Mediterranean phage uvMED]
MPGSIMAASLTGLLLGTTMVLFTKLPVAPPTVPTSVENTFGKNESLELWVKLPSGEELLVKVTGENTTEVVQSLKKMLKSMDGSLLLEKSSPYTGHLEGSTTKRLDSSSSMTF